MYISVPMPGRQAGQQALCVCQILHIRLKAVLVDTFRLASERESEEQCLFDLVVQPLHRWCPLSSGTSSSPTCLEVFVAESPTTMDVLQMIGEDPNSRWSMKR